MSVADDLDLESELARYKKFREEARAEFVAHNGGFMQPDSEERYEKLGLTKTFSQWLVERGAVAIELETFLY